MYYVVCNLFITYFIKFNNRIKKKLRKIFNHRAHICFVHLHVEQLLNYSLNLLRALCWNKINWSSVDSMTKCICHCAICHMLYARQNKIYAKLIKIRLVWLSDTLHFTTTVYSLLGVCRTIYLKKIKWRKTQKKTFISHINVYFVLSYVDDDIGSQHICTNCNKYNTTLWFVRGKHTHFILSNEP